MGEPHSDQKGVGRGSNDKRPQEILESPGKL